MNPQLFADNFGHLASAPDGVRRLRYLVSYFAITGGLSTHYASDSDATTLASETLRAKQKYLETSSTRRSKRKNAELRQTVAQIPERWILLPAGDLVDLINGRAFKASDWKTSGLPIIRIQNLNNPKAPYNHYQGEVSEGHRVEHGDMLLSWSGTPGTSFGAFIWGGGEAVLNQHIFKVIIFSNRIDKEYLRIAINACLDALIGSARGGVGLKHVTKGQIEALQIPCPPLEEQKRIVAKVNELMALCNKLEAQQLERQKLFPSLSRACNTSFADLPTPATLKRVFDETGSISPNDLRRTILSLAVQGKLVEFGDSKQGETVGDHVEFLNGYAFKSEWFKPSGHRLCRNVNVSHGVIDWREMVCVDDDVADEFERFRLAEGDIVLSLDRPLISTGLKVARVRNEDLPCLLLQRVAKPIMKHDKIDPSYFYLWLNSPEFIESIDPGRSNGVPHISTRQVQRLSFRLPSLDEQHRVVSKTAELLIIVDQLEAQHLERDGLAKDFATYTVAAITGTETQDSESMKAPKTELITKLQIGCKPKTDDNAPLANLITKQKKGVSAKTLWQQSGFEIDAFYHQLKAEMAEGWIVEPEKAVMKEVEAN